MGVKLGSRLQLAIGTIPEGGLNEARPVSKVALLGRVYHVSFSNYRVDRSPASRLKLYSRNS